MEIIEENKNKIFKVLAFLLVVLSVYFVVKIISTTEKLPLSTVANNILTDKDLLTGVKRTLLIDKMFSTTEEELLSSNKMFSTTNKRSLLINKDLLLIDKKVLITIKMPKLAKNARQEWICRQ